MQIIPGERLYKTDIKNNFIYLFWLLIVPISYSNYYRTVSRPRYTHNGVVIPVTHIINLGVEPRDLLLAAQLLYVQLQTSTNPVIS